MQLTALGVDSFCLQLPLICCTFTTKPEPVKIVKLHRPFVHIVLALLLLCSQQLGLAHGLSHLRAGGESVQLRQTGKAALLDAHCEQCQTFAQTAHMLPFAAHTPAALLKADFLLHLSPEYQFQAAFAPLYQARAPPVA